MTRMTRWIARKSADQEKGKAQVGAKTAKDSTEARQFLPAYVVIPRGSGNPDNPPGISMSQKDSRNRKIILQCVQRAMPFACERSDPLLNCPHIGTSTLMPPPAIQTKRWTRQEYERMAALGLFSPDERVQLIEGEIVTMTPQNSPHAAAIGKTQRSLDRVFGASIWVRVQMPLIIDPDSEPEPDLAVVQGIPDDYSDHHPGSALLVVEVSDTTLPLDRDRKRTLYARAGILEYWIVNLAERCLEVYREPVNQPGQPASYRSFQKVRPSDRVSPLAATSALIAVADLLP